MYTLYIGKRCIQCQEIIEFLRCNGIQFNVVHLDRDKDQPPPFDLFVAPALFRDDKLLYYGTDILDFFRKQIKDPVEVGTVGKFRIFMAKFMPYMMIYK